MKILLRSICLLMAISFFSPVLAQETLKAEAMSAFADGEYAKAKVKFEDYLETNSEDNQAWYMKGLSQIKLRKYPQAKLSLEQAKLHGYSPISQIHFNLAKCYAQMRKPASAVDQIKLANDNGFAQFNRLKSDVEFASVLMRSDFQEEIKRAMGNAYPCTVNPNYSKFDFWVGSWDVFTLQGQKIGHNEITKSIGNCAVHESYTTGRAYVGQSINYYDPIHKKWRQHWVGSSGDIIDFLETDEYDAALQFVGPSMVGPGQVVLKRMTFTTNKDGTVNQLFEVSQDEGKTWAIEYDLIYRRVGE